MTVVKKVPEYIRALLGCDQGLRTVYARTGMGQNNVQLRIGFGHRNGKGRKCTRHAVSGMDDYRNVQFDGGLKYFLGLRSQRAGAKCIRLKLQYLETEFFYGPLDK